MLLSNSKVEVRFYADNETFLTHDSFLAKKDVNNSDILLPGVVDVLLKNRGDRKGCIIKS